MTAFLQNGIVRGAISGFVAAAIVDLHAFMTFKSPNDVKQYAWGTAVLRWTQGLIGGAVSAWGLGAIS
jgi:heme A synthase